MKKPFVLTPNEEFIMNIFWTENQELTSVELTKLCKPQGWVQEQILNMLRSIKKKGFLEVCGTVQYGKQYARSFTPSISKEEYAAMFAASLGISEEDIIKATVALVKTICKTDDVIGCLEKIIKELKEERDKK